MTTSSAVKEIADVPVLTELDSSDFGSSFDWVADDLFCRSYQGLVRMPEGLLHHPVGLAAYRNADVQALGIHTSVSHEEFLPGQETAAASSGLERFMLSSTFGIQPPRHRPAKSIVSRRLTPKSVGRFLDAGARITDELVAEAAERETIDFVLDFMRPLVIRFWAEVLGVGVDPDEAARLRRSLEGLEMVFLFRPSEEEMAIADRAAEEYVEVVTTALEREARNGEHDVLTELAADYETMGELGRPENVYEHFGVALADAFNTMGSVTANVVQGLLAEQSSLERVRADRSLVSEAWAEGARLNPAVIGTTRSAMADFEYDGLFVPEGTPILMLWLFGNRDPAVFDQPNEFRLERENRSMQTTFAGGFYACPGRHISRLLGEIIVKALTEPSVEIVATEPAVWKVRSTFHEPERMPVAIRRL